MRVRIVARDPTLEVLDFDRPRWSIGRVRGNDVVLQLESVSRYHCVLYGHGELALVADAASADGTRIGGRQHRRVILEPGWEIDFNGARVSVDGCRAHSVADLEALAARDTLPLPVLLQLHVLHPELAAIGEAIERIVAGAAPRSLDVADADLRTLGCGVQMPRIVAEAAARSTDAAVRRHVGIHPDLADATLQMLDRDPDPGVQQAAARTTRDEQRIVAHAHSAAPAVRAGTAANPSTPSPALEQLLVDASPEVRRALTDRALPRRIAEMLARDPDRIARLKAAWMLGVADLSLSFIPVPEWAWATHSGGPEGPQTGIGARHSTDATLEGLVAIGGEQQRWTLTAHFEARPFIADPPHLMFQFHGGTLQLSSGASYTGVHGHASWTAPDLCRAAVSLMDGSGHVPLHGEGRWTPEDPATLPPLDCARGRATVRITLDVTRGQGRLLAAFLGAAVSSDHAHTFGGR